jgi:hypothetical protein
VWWLLALALWLRPVAGGVRGVNRRARAAARAARRNEESDDERAAGSLVAMTIANSEDARVSQLPSTGAQKTTHGSQARLALLPPSPPL